MFYLIEKEREREIEKSFAKNKVIFHFIDKATAPVNWKCFKDHVTKDGKLLIDNNKSYYLLLGKIEKIKKVLADFIPEQYAVEVL